jgi:hypothetical protein
VSAPDDATAVADRPDAPPAPDTRSAPPDADTTELRTGAPLSDQLLALLPLVGVWRGTGTGAVASTGDEFAFGQQLSFAHDGRPFLVYESRTWLVDAAGDLIRLAFRETGYWRPGARPDDIEVALATAAGIVEVFAGTAGELQWEIMSTSAGGTRTARAVIGERRLYALVDDDLAYASELHVPGAGGFTPHLTARLERLG